MLDTRASLRDLMSNVDTLVKTAEKTAAARTVSVKAAASKAEALKRAVDSVTSEAKLAAADLRQMDAQRLEKRAEKVAIARHIFRTAVRLAG